MYYWHSSIVVIDQYSGDYRDELSPEWLKTMQTECQFWQNRTLMLEMILYFVQNILILVYQGESCPGVELCR